MVMDNRKTYYILQRTEQISIGLAVLLLCGILSAFLINWGGRHEPRHSGHSLGPALSSLKRPPLEEYLAVLGRREMFKESLIYETKKPEVVNALGDLVYLGMIQDKQSPRAFIMNTKSKQSAIYSSGEAIEDLQILEIRNDRIRFQHGSEVLDLIR